jgi:hypothetical protein
MLSEISKPTAHVGEDQSSRQFEARAAHWSNLAVQLLLVAKRLANDYLQDENDDGSLCVDAEHHAAVQAPFSAIKGADRAGLSDACAALAAMDIGRGVFWSVTGDKYEFGSLPALLADAKSDFLRPGDFVYQAQSVGRHKLTEADFVQAAAVNAPARDPRVPDMFEVGGAT